MLLDHLASMFNNHFDPGFTVGRKHLVVTPGAAAGLDAVLYSVCDPGDGVLVPAPYWGKYYPWLPSPDIYISICLSNIRNTEVGVM